MISFDTVWDRRETNSLKWGLYQGTDILPLWVADMEFAAPEPVLDALQARMAHPIFGYTRPSEGLSQALVQHLDEEFGWQIKPEWCVFLPGVVPGLSAACRGFGANGDAAMTSSPIYHHFLHIAQDAGKALIDVPLKQQDGRYSYDIEAMEAAVTPRTKLLLLSSPHNPVGRVFSREELTELTDFALKHDLLIVSDEIHCGLVLDPTLRHTPTAMISPDVSDQTITLFSTSKTFNLAGLNTSVAIIENPAIRQQFQAASAGVMGELSPLALAATEAALRDGGAWRAELLDYLRGNYALIEQAVESWDEVSMAPLESTYLAWINIGQTGIGCPQAFFEQQARVGVSPGSLFGDADYLRMNFACQRSMLEQALSSMGDALKRHANERLG